MPGALWDGLGGPELSHQGNYAYVEWNGGAIET